MTHSMRLRKESFEAIRSGKKSIDIRILDEKRKFLKRDDEIEYSLLGDPTQKFRALIIDTHKFASFEELFKAFDCESLGSDTREGLAYIYDIYTKEEEKAYGVIGIEVRVVPQ